MGEGRDTEGGGEELRPADPAAAYCYRPTTEDRLWTICGVIEHRQTPPMGAGEGGGGLQCRADPSVDSRRRWPLASHRRGRNIDGLDGWLAESTPRPPDREAERPTTATDDPRPPVPGPAGLS